MACIHQVHFVGRSVFDRIFCKLAIWQQNRINRCTVLHDHEFAIYLTLCGAHKRWIQPVLVQFQFLFHLHV